MEIMHKPKIHRNRAVVLLRKAGVSFYSIAIAVKDDKRNLIRVYKRDKDKYFLPFETKHKWSKKNGNNK